MPELPDLKTPVKIRVLKGPQWEKFDEKDHERFLSGTYTVTNQSDRMGYRLKGDAMQTKQESMLSAATVMGGLQVPANGEPIVLMADRKRLAAIHYWQSWRQLTCLNWCSVVQNSRLNSN